MNEQPMETVQKLMIWPDAILSRKTKEVTNFDTQFTQDLINLHKVLKELNGLGLSACQIGDDRSFFVFQVGDREGVMVNPKIISDSGSMTHTSKEGCLSFPGVFVEIERFNYVTVQFQDEDGQQHEEDFIGLLGNCVQHEIDHLNGKTMIQHLSRLKRDIVDRKMKKLGKRLDRVRKVNANAAKRALRGPDPLERTGVPSDAGRRDTRLHRVHLPSE